MWKRVTPSPCCHHIFVPTFAVSDFQNMYLYKQGQGQLLLLEHAMEYLDHLLLLLIQPAKITICWIWHNFHYLINRIIINMFSWFNWLPSLHTQFWFHGVDLIKRKWNAKLQWLQLVWSVQTITEKGKKYLERYNYHIFAIVRWHKPITPRSNFPVNNTIPWHKFIKFSIAMNSNLQSLQHRKQYKIKKKKSRIIK